MNLVLRIIYTVYTVIVKIEGLFKFYIECKSPVSYVSCFVEERSMKTSSKIVA